VFSAPLWLNKLFLNRRAAVKIQTNSKFQKQRIMRILIVEDDDRIAKPLAEFLRRQHHIVDITTDGLAAWEWSQSGLYELILLDLMLPKLDGITLCKRLRNASSNILILMLMLLMNYAAH
jgi:CheY-like chemotaxis protein